MSDTVGSENSFPSEQYHFPHPGRLEDDWRKWGFGQVVVGYGLSLVASIVTLSLISELAGYEKWDDLPMWGVSLVGLSQQLVLIFAVMISASAFGFSLQKDFLFQTKQSDVGKGLCYGVAAQLLVVPFVTYPFVWIFDIDTDQISEPARELSDKATSPLGVVAIIITVGLLAPVAEELFFRGLLYGSIRKRGNSEKSRKVIVWTSVIISSAIFSAIHFQLLLFPALFVVGMIFALIYERSQRLALAIWAHVGFNATTLFSLLVLD